jgi:hypothetical protein
VTVVQLDGFPVNVGDHGAAVAALVFREVAADFAEAIVGGIVGTVFPLGPHHFGVGGHAFFHPGVAPVVDHQQVAKPLVGQLVGHQGFGIAVVQGGPLVQQAAVGEDGDRRCFPCRQR